MNKNALLVFAKAPVAGQAKTRLIPEIGAQGAAKLHEKLVLRTLDALLKPDGWDTLLWTAGDGKHDFFQQIVSNYDVKLFAQQGNDLGQRMFNALVTSLKNFDAVCIVGTDCPVLETKNIDAAFKALDTADIVFNPAEDGGYVLIAARSIDQRVFENVPWGTGEVMQKTLDNIQKIDWNVSLLDTLWDVDEPADLARLQAETSFQ